MDLTLDAPVSDTRRKEVIARSWKRSSACGVTPGMDLQLPYDQDFDEDSRLLRAAQPVLERLISMIPNTSHSVLLADPDGRLIHRWVGASSLGNKLDQASIAPGFGFPEEFAGTNGVGTALEESQIVAVHGTEHYTEKLHSFSCVGVPIRNPMRGRIEGVLDFTCLTSDFNPLILPLLVEVGKHIETRFAQQSSASEFALFEAFVQTCRRHRGPVLALRRNMLLTNTAASEQLTSADRAVLWDLATMLMASGRDEGTVDLSGGRSAIRITPVAGTATVDPGLVIRLAPMRARPEIRTRRPSTTAPSVSSIPLKGRSAQWAQVLDKLSTLAGVKEPIAVTGGPGSGKMQVAQHLHQVINPGSALRVFDGSIERVDTSTPLANRCRDALRQGETVIVRRIDKLPSSVQTDLIDLVRSESGRMKLIATCTDDPQDTATRALAAFPHQLWIPPLAQRVEDIADIVPTILAELSPGHPVRCSSSAQQVLMRYAWPGNVAELRDVLKAAVASSPRGPIESNHLPAWLLKRAHRRPLTPMEQSERDLIIDTLASVSNNRSEAARILGIGRATLYRKLRNLGISTD
ncbi:GAF domain-containing protein [Rhodococcus rhodochrous]|uniref:GAF domain-containing protein n=1 Tax=Rhodococcus rhodochrous TaxID=1829 RepID=A0AAW4XNF5_RHORH|nr:helix-turn-helix domain-containing protein [Rhodococcus rhodochrous]MCD2114598.1 GAF domain-containing protein [Rhodococcus rhodochrous]